MKQLKCFSLLLLAAMALTTVVNAQVINGDLNHNQGLDVEDVTLLIDGYLTGEAEWFTPKIDFYQEDNSLIYGKWWNTKGEFVWYQENGTINGLSFLTYKFFPSQGRILMYNNDSLYTSVDVLYLTDEVMIRRYSDGTHETFTRTRPEVKVTNITLYTSGNWELADDILLFIHNSNGQKDSQQLYAYIEPDAADNKDVVWSSSDESVATVVNGVVQAVGEGNAYIVCALADGSDVSATCVVTVMRQKAYNSGYEYVDLGLSVKWATMNVGANAPEEYGDYFAWGETLPKNEYSWENYEWCKGSYSTLTKYCTHSDYGTVDNKTVLDPEDDAASENWGSTWRMPTKEELDELMEDCSWKRVTQNGVDGRLVTGRNGNSIFLPAAGFCKDSSLYHAGDNGYYVSSSCYHWESYSSGLYFEPDLKWILEVKCTRCDGFCVRAVFP